jgi:hypothetical protein
MNVRVLFVAILAATLSAPALSASSKCKTIQAVHDDLLLPPGPGCPSPVGFCAGGDSLRGNHRFRGSFFFSAITFSPIPGDPLGRLSVPGISTYTTPDGTLTISDVSVFDPAPPQGTGTGTFAGTGRITAGTGRFAGATGDIFTTGRVSEDGLSFTTEATIEICFAS